MADVDLSGLIYDQEKENKKLNLTGLKSLQEYNGVDLSGLVVNSEGDAFEDAIPVRNDSLRNLLAEDVRQVKAKDEPVVTDAMSAIVKAGGRYSKGILKSVEDVQSGKTPDVIGNIFSPTEDKRTSMEIAQSIGMKVLPEAKIKDPESHAEYLGTFAKEFIQTLPFSIAGGMAELTNPINIAAGAAITKLPNVAISAPKWIDDAIKKTISVFGAPFSTLDKAAKETLTKKISEAIYEKVSPRKAELEANYKELYGKTPTEADLKAEITAKLLKGGIDKENIADLTKRYLGVTTQKPLSQLAEQPQQIGQPSQAASSIVPSAPVGQGPNPSSIPMWARSLGKTPEEAIANLQALITGAKSPQDAIAAIKKGITLDNISGGQGVSGLELPSDSQIVEDIARGGFNFQGQNNTNVVDYNEKLRLRAEKTQGNFWDDVLQHVPSEDFIPSEKVLADSHRNLITRIFDSFQSGPAGQSIYAIDKSLHRFPQWGKNRLPSDIEDALIAYRDSAEGATLKLVDQLTFAKDLTPADDTLLFFHAEDPVKYPIPQKLEFYKQKYDALDKIARETTIKELGVEESDLFPNGFIRKIEKKISRLEDEKLSLTAPEAIKRRDDQIAELKDEIDYVKDKKYQRHEYNNKWYTRAARFLNYRKLSTPGSKLKGRIYPTADRAIEAGAPIITRRSLVTALHLQYLSEEVAKVRLVKWLKANPTFVLPEKEAPSDWVNIHHAQLSGFKVNPILDDVLNDFLSPHTDHHMFVKAYDKANNWLKSAIFWNPLVQILNQAQLNFLAGSLLNTNFPKWLNESIKSIIGKDELYNEVSKLGLFSSPVESRIDIEEQIKVLFKDQDPILTKAFKMVDPVIFWKKLQDLTWLMDKTSRMVSVKYFLKKGFTLRDAVHRSNLYHIDYSFLNPKLRKISNRLLLVPTWKAGLARLGLAMLLHPVQNRGAISRFLAYLIFLNLGASWFKYSLEDGYRLVKKLDNPITTEDNKVLTDFVISLPSPLHEVQKLYSRSVQKTLNMNLSRIPFIYTSLAANKDWRGEEIYDRALPAGDQARQQMEYVIKTALAPLDAWDSMTQEQQHATHKVLQILGLSVYNREGQTRYLIDKIQSIHAQRMSWLRKHPKSTDVQQKEVNIETQKRIDHTLRKIEEYERIK